MSRARPVIPGASLMLTRSVHHRQFALRPSKQANQIIAYVIAVMAERWNIRVHALDVLSNHLHNCVTDPDGNIVQFQHDCHQFIARALNATYGDTESMWASEQTSQVHCVEPSDLINKIVYTMANPVQALLVRFGHSWPGVRRCWPAKPWVIKRPHKFFVGEEFGGKWPAEVTFSMSRPPGFDHLSDDELAELLAAEIHGREQRFRDQYDAEGKSFLGRRAVLRQSRYGRPRTARPRFGMSPKVACRNRWRRVERLQQDAEWLRSYNNARDRWCAGDHSVLFPAGTYKMRVLYGVRCASPPT